VKTEIILYEICKFLHLNFYSLGTGIFSLFQVTGDSGRASDSIGSRVRIAPEDVLLQCKNYK
jgi:hypothetical protein